MEALTQTYASKFLPINIREFSSSSSSSLALTPLLFRFPISDTKKNADFLHSLSLQSRISVLSSPISSSTTPLQAGVGANVDSLTESAYRSNTVHVKFQLQKECAYGEHFFLVGDHPIIGIWDPASAIPLNWSDDHLWVVELDLPIGKSIRFKFILKGPTEEVLWQPGPDRMLETWETQNTIVIYQDWENPDIQIIAEEPSKYPVADQIVLEDVSNAIGDNDFLAEEETAVNDAQVNRKTVGEEFKLEKEHKSFDNSFQGSLVAGNILMRNGISATGKKLGSAEDENMDGHVQEPVLVPGLTPSVTRRSEEILLRKAESNSELRSSSVVDEDEDPGVSKPDEEEEEKEHEKKEADGSQNQKGATITVIDNVCGQEQDISELKENDEINTAHELAEGQDALQNDFQWGRKALSKFFNDAGTLFR